MLTQAPNQRDATSIAISRASARGVDVVWWQPERTVTGANSSRPVLYLVEAGATPPATWGVLEDWVRLPADAGEVYDRAERLLLRFDGAHLTTEVDEDGVLRAGDALVPLSPMEGNLMGALLEAPNAMVSRQDLEARLWPDGRPSDPRAIDNRIKVLRRSITGLPMRIHTVRGRGFMLEMIPIVAAFMNELG